MGCIVSTPDKKFDAQDYTQSLPSVPKIRSSTKLLDFDTVKTKSNTQVNLPYKVSQPKATIILEVALINGQVQNLTVNTDALSPQLKKDIYEKLSQQLKPELMSLYLQQTKMSSITSVANLRPNLPAGSKLRIRQTKVQLKEVKGLIVNAEEIDPFTQQKGVAKMSCGHFIGRESVISIIRTTISLRNYQIKCPYQSCPIFWDFDLCKKVGILTKTELNEFETGLALNKINQEMKQCPSCKFTVVRLNLTTNHVACPCGASPFCYQCMLPWKGGDSRVQCGNQQCNFFDDLLQNCPQSARFVLSGKVYNLPKYRACVHCSIVIEHQKYCKHMTCTACKKSFCFVCLSIPNSNGIFTCKLFSDYCGTVAGRQSIKSKKK